jgi:hypothetical protein
MISFVTKPSYVSDASVDSPTIIEIAHVTGTMAVIKSPHFERLTPRVSRRGLFRNWHQRTVHKKEMKKKTIKKMKKNQSQNW